MLKHDQEREETVEGWRDETLSGGRVDTGKCTDLQFWQEKYDLKEVKDDACFCGETVLF